MCFNRGVGNLIQTPLLSPNHLLQFGQWDLNSLHKIHHLANYGNRWDPTVVLDIRPISMWAIPTKIQAQESGGFLRNIYFWCCHMVTPFCLPWPESTIHVAYMQIDWIYLFVPFNFNFFCVLPCYLCYSLIFSPFIYITYELSWEVEGHRILVWLGFGSWGEVAPETYCILSFAKFSILLAPCPRYSTYSLPCCSIPSAKKREMEMVDRSGKPKSS